MKFDRASGVLLHPTSLPGPYGIGDLGLAAIRWIDFLAEAGCKLWQVLPLGPTGYGDSPYQCFSAFAGNPYLISPDYLLRDGLLEAADLADKPRFLEGRVDFGTLIPWKLELLERAFQRFTEMPPVLSGVGLEPLHADFDTFCSEQSNWLEDYALFMAIKEKLGGGSWDGWPSGLRQRENVALDGFRGENANTLARFRFYQFLFFRQWNALHAYARQKGIEIIGDIPIFVAYDSADVWSHPDLFFLDDQGKPTVVAGVPPDYFSPTGQLWGNPLYRWHVHERTGYAWWVERIRAALNQADLVRIDHFRGFAAYWEIPAGNPTAEVGQWVPGPGEDFFEAVQAALAGTRGEADASLPIIAEDLGLITPDVVALRQKFNFPGMKILQFAFSGPDNPFLPHHYPKNCVVYTGTHDNDTTSGWYASAPEEETEFARRYLHVDGKDFVWDIIRTAWASVAVFALAPMQDLLGLGTEARMNFPSRLGGNWEWRMQEGDLSDALQARLKEFNRLYQR
jgi:4-alpha-glucanotransferase